MIRIEPAEANYLYIPIYDPYYVYGLAVSRLSAFIFTIRN